MLSCIKGAKGENPCDLPFRKELLMNFSLKNKGVIVKLEYLIN